MKGLTEFIDEAKYTNKYNKNNEMLLWFKVWSKLSSDGPMTKKEVLTALGLKPTSYSGMFAEMTARGIIVPDKSKRGALAAAPEDKWDLDAIAWHEVPGADFIDRHRNFDEYYDYDEKTDRIKLKPEYRDKPGEASAE